MLEPLQHLDRGQLPAGRHTESLGEQKENIKMRRTVAETDGTTPIAPDHLRRGLRRGQTHGTRRVSA
jgi:hypothetical protein